MKTKIIFVCVILLSSTGISSSFALNREDINSIQNGDDWWNDNWIYRKQISIDHTVVNDNLSNFPVLICNESIDFALHCQSDGDDFVFTTLSGSKLDHEIEYFDSNIGELIAWVKIPQLSSVLDTEIYLYYGNLECGNQQNADDVWETDYKAVYHLKEEGIGTRYDSSGYDNHAAPKFYDGDEAISGWIDGADQIFGNDDRLQTSSLIFNSFETVTISAWFSTSVSTGTKNIAACWVDTGSSTVSMVIDLDKIQIGIDIPGSGNVQYVYGLTSCTDGIWHYAVATFNMSNDTVQIFLDGNLDEVDSSITNNPTPTDFYHLGNDPFKISSFKGVLDEIRFSQTIRSPEWIATEYTNQYEPKKFVDFSEQEIINYAPTTPFINGPSSGFIEIEYSYTVISEDPNGDDIYYNVDWGDGTIEDWFGPYPSNELIIVNHTWTDQGTFIIRARAKDIDGEISDWGTLEVSMPKSYVSLIPKTNLMIQHIKQYITTF